MAYRDDRALGDVKVDRDEIEDLRKQVAEVYGDRASFSANIKDDGTLDIRLEIQDERTWDFDQRPQTNLFESESLDLSNGDLEKARSLNAERTENAGQDIAPDFGRDENEYDALVREVAALRAEAFATRDAGVGADLSDARLIDLDENAIRLDGPVQDRASTLEFGAFDAAQPQFDARFDLQSDNGLQLDNGLQIEERYAVDRAFLDRGPPPYHGTDLQAELDRVNAQIAAASRSGQVAGVGLDKADTAFEKNASDNLGSLYSKLHDLENEPGLDAQINGNLELTKGSAQPSQGFSLQNALDEINRGIAELKERLGIDYSLDDRSRQSAFGRG